MAITRSMVLINACSGVMPWRMNSTARKAPQTLMFASPRPVEPAAPTVLSQYCPAPMIGESPTRPGIFHAIPLVVVTELRSPLASTAFMLIVPHVWATPRASYSSSFPASPAPSGLRGAAPDDAGACDASSQASFAFRVRFHFSHSALLRQQVLLGEAHLQREPFRVVADEQDVVGVIHDRLRHQRRRGDPFEARDRPGAPRRPVHAARVQLDHAVLVRQSAEADALVVGVELLDVDAGD